MRLCDFILEEAVLGELRAGTKREALATLVRALVDAGCLDPNALDSVVEALLRREEIGSTGIGHGVAIPHAKHSAVRRLLGAYAHSSAGVPFDALDGQPVTCIFLLLWPDGVIGPHLEAIAQVSRVLKQEGFLDRLRAAADKREITGLLAEADGHTRSERGS